MLNLTLTFLSSFDILSFDILECSVKTVLIPAIIKIPHHSGLVICAVRSESTMSGHGFAPPSNHINGHHYMVQTASLLGMQMLGSRTV